MDSDDRRKNEILEAIIDLLDSDAVKWGDGGDKVIIRIVLKGKYNLDKPNINVTPKKRFTIL